MPTTNELNQQRNTHFDIEALSRSLPYLPGHCFNFKEKPNFRKSHAFDHINKVSIFREEKPGIGGVPLLGQKDKALKTSADLYKFPENATETAPAWIAFDRKVLRFYAYFQEAVQERREEQYRIRKVNILFYLEDDTIHVIEPRKQNSGFPQGTLIRRHRIPLPGHEPHDQQYYLFNDLNVNKEVTFYARTFKIVGCDGFTRDFMSQQGYDIPANTDYPDDPYETMRREMLSHMKPTRPVPPKTALKKFLENDRKVLRFYCVWDDTRSAFGDARKMVLHYFLADDTIEIHEFIAPNSGRDAATGFLRRGKLPKRHKKMPDMVGQSEPFYCDRDLMIGTVLNVYGRPFLVCDCDEFTKFYYRERYDLHDFTPIPYDSIFIENAPLPSHSITFLPPEYNGWGSEEDSLGNCLSLIPKPPKHDLHKEQTFGNTVLRFAAILNTHRPSDRERRFVVTYHLSDDTVQVFEPHRRNSGIISGKFLERSKVKFGERYLSTQDFYIGAELILSAFPFIIIGADEFALRFMDDNIDLFPNHMKRGTEVNGKGIQLSAIELGQKEAPLEPISKDRVDSKGTLPLNQ